MTKDERIECIDDAQEKLGEVIELIEKAVSGLGIEGMTRAYLIDHLKIYHTNSHGFLSNDPNLDRLREQLEDSDEALIDEKESEEDEDDWDEEGDDWDEEGDE